MQDQNSLLTLAALGLGVVVALGWWLATSRAKVERRATEEGQRRTTVAESEVQRLQAALEGASEERTRYAERASRIPALEARLHELDMALAARADTLQACTAALAAVRQELRSEREQGAQKLALLAQARVALSDQFKAIAAEILDEKSRKFTELNQANLDQLLTPFRQQMTDFRSKVEEVYLTESKDRSALKEQVAQLQLLNQALHQDASKLTLALTGDRKAQGNWGEIILDDVLERAGLREGDHYQRQVVLKAEDGVSKVIPDVIIKLPGERQIVIDSKFTLPDYRAFADAHDEMERSAALKRHLVAIRNHIKGLSEKNYQSLHALTTLDFVVMFVPLEPAFMVAVTNDPELFTDAWSRNVLLVSPSTLLFVVRTIAHLWRQDELGRNARDISARGAALYDKFTGFVADLEKVGAGLDQAHKGYEQARHKLSIGRGSLVRQAEMLRELGVKPTRGLKKQWTDRMLEDTGGDDPENTADT